MKPDQSSDKTVISHRPKELVELKGFLSDQIGFTGNNVFKRKFYKTNFIGVHQDLLEPLNQIQKELNGMGYQLKIIDAYRPLSVQRIIFDIIKNPSYVSDPLMSRHTRGTAVDVTICDMEGIPLKMQSDYCEFSTLSNAYRLDLPSDILSNRTLLQKVMTTHGFEIYEHEWWHFDFHDFLSYPIWDWDF